ncbi:argininosuccinate lyase [Brochothrix campestris]|uniref:Argininosuccinate lyase n=1 Tax=Brochothrix campestris FSL F6-1037 TaxID=1265861 RepID=W7CTS6_9LIST|nr:argininosuccinate lyase [Brochothrix campestris]EUJ40292.1 argininosuccinate lyase [Brochothrix campestris FSL F6-1037]
MSSKLWGGRFAATNEEWVDSFGASISFDQQLVAEDIQGSLAHVSMLGATGILPPDDVALIKSGLTTLAQRARAGELTYREANEDIHLNIEQLLHDEIGPVAGKLHTGRSRNDQVATDLHLYLKKEVIHATDLLTKLQAVIVQLATDHVYTVMPGYTHLQRAQPISFAHHLLAYFWMLERDKERFRDSLKRVDLSPLGASALAGTTFPIDRHLSADLLGFSKPYANSLDAVSDRDFAVEYLSNASLVMMHLSRLCEELIVWSTDEFNFIELSDTFATGSSIMPQKKNPDMAELIRGKTGRVYGDLVGLLTVLKGIPLAYNKDMQEDKEGVFDTAHTLAGSLTIMAGMLESMTVNVDHLAETTTKDFSNATELADYLAAKQVPFRQAHEIVGKLVLQCIQAQHYLADLTLAQLQAAHPLFEADIYTVLQPQTAVARRNSFGGTGFEQVLQQLEQAKDAL